ncbi:MAG: hypothetical protein WAQ32_06535 [Dethiobacteria bacterium]|jgi:hypothetical protein|nr:hypothetical protein [Bacillota bacterium]NMD33240.1 hypothetical protein [Bacillota bacterium]HOB29043.1 hypothetical protein [Bacillota bacterium]HPZ41129.1 hypothetical protein [Bacillota bacterium]HQD52628.1 hypothetical protein [Bacillota bacterium]
MDEGVDVVIFEGTAAASPVEEMIIRVRQALLYDNLEKLSRIGPVRQIFLITNNPALTGMARATGTEFILNRQHPDSFHFGHELKRLVLAQDLKKVFYLSGAGCPLITTVELEEICGKLAGSSSLLYANNIQSADIIAFTVPDSFADTDLPDMDNSLAMTLRDRCGMELELMPQTLGLLFDLDTPADILVLGSGPFAGPRARAVLDDLALDYSRLERAKEVLKDSYQDVALIGRVGAPIIERLNALLKLRLRVFSEERGMKALGRLDDGTVISLLGFLIEQAGLENFFEYLAQVARCAFIDSRVLFAHYNYNFTDRERYLSDLGLWEQIEHPWLKEFTRLAVQSPIPVILGGHSLVSGSLWALSCELDPARREAAG